MTRLEELKAAREKVEDACVALDVLGWRADLEDMYSTWRNLNDAIYKETHHE